MDVIDMYRMLQRDKPILQDAFEAFKNGQNVRNWHDKFHEQYERRGQGQYVAKIMMKTCLKTSVDQWGMANQNKMHQNFEGFIAWSLSTDQPVWRQAAENALCFMEKLGDMIWVQDDIMKQFPDWKEFDWNEFEINDEWNIMWLQERIVSLEDKRRNHR